jgi:thymidylate synthase (FAD)
MISFDDVLGDGVGNAHLIDSMGDDLTVVNAARVSMGKESFWEMSKLPERDAKLINYLAKHQHWTPFSHVMVTLRLKMPIFVARQWFKHTIGFTRNEISRRYVDETPEFYSPERLRLRADNVKQGSSDEEIETDEFNKEYEDSALALYRLNLDDGVAPELARMYLPQSTYTEFYETASLAAYARLFNLRTEETSQQEIRKYAEVVGEICSWIAEESWDALSKQR